MEKKPYKELKEILEANCPPVNSRWRHYGSGDEYFVRAVAVAEATQEPIVIYHNLWDLDAVDMARPAAEWEETVLHDGRRVPRFTRSG